MICPNCKKEIDNDSKFCRHCGVEFLEETEPAIEISQHKNENNPQTSMNKGLLVKIIAAATVVLVLCGLIAVIATQTGSGGLGKETVTDAEGEKIREGRGTTEMSVKDIDGNVRTIKTDRSLLTPDSILSEYTAVMNRLKSDAPAFSYVRYQNLPTEYQNLGAAADFVLPIIEKYVTSKTASKEVVYTAGNAEKLPLPNSAYGCLLTDSTKIKNAYCEIIDDDMYKLVITLTDELNPQPVSAGATTAQSAITAIFDPYDAAQQITAISELALNKIDFNYTDCTVTLIYDYDSKQVQSINMTMNIDITANTLLMEIKARIVDISEYTSITY